MILRSVHARGSLPRPALCVFAGLALSLAVTACSHEPQAAAADAASATAALSATAPATTTSPASDAAAVPHGDHNPHHGGIVFMHGETHFEAVLGRDGTHQIYFSDAVRADLPAAVAANVTIVVTRADGAPETLTATIDDSGESWVAHGRPVGPGEASARISFTSADGPYFIDTPFLAPAP